MNLKRAVEEPRNTRNTRKGSTENNLEEAETINLPKGQVQILPRPRFFVSYPMIRGSNCLFWVEGLKRRRAWLLFKSSTLHPSTPGEQCGLTRIAHQSSSGAPACRRLCALECPKPVTDRRSDLPAMQTARQFGPAAAGLRPRRAPSRGRLTELVVSNAG